jgi:MoxR-like ATPase
MPARTSAAPADHLHRTENERPNPEAMDDKAAAALLVDSFRRVKEEMAKFIVGQQEVVEQLVIAVLAGGHCLLEGVPGLAKTAMVRSLARCMDLSFKRRRRCSRRCRSAR